MFLKIAFVLFLCCTLVMGYSIESRTKRQAHDQMQFTTVGSTADRTRTSNDDSNNTNFDSSNIGSNIGNPMRELGNRMKNAFNKTYQEESNSVSDSWNNVKDLMVQNMQTGANLTKTAFDLGTILPKFGKNFILSDDNK